MIWNKKLAVLMLFLVAYPYGYAQIKFEPGYYITNSGERVEGFIKNIEWKNNPTEFEFRQTQTSTSQINSIIDVKEFGVNQSISYVRHVVDIDRSTNKLHELNWERNPVFKRDTLFLKVIVNGSAKLLRYEEADLDKFFLQLESGIPEQLFYKRYKHDVSGLLENFSFRQQLHSKLVCNSITTKDVEKIGYYKQDLEKIVLKYNECKGDALAVKERQKFTELVNVNVRPGVNISSLSLDDTNLIDFTFDFETFVSFRLGIEGEIILPYNKNKWAIIVEPTYQYFKGEKARAQYFVVVDYRSIEVPIGLRHYFYLPSRTAFFLDVAANVDIPFGTIQHTYEGDMNIGSGVNYVVGAGCRIRDRFSIEARYYSAKEITEGNPGWTSTYQTTAFILGYRIF